VTAGRGLIAEFPSADALLAGVSALEDAGYREIETYAPFPVPGLERRLRLGPSRLPWIIFLGGLAGGALGYLIQWYADVRAYLVNSGGRPAHAIPAFIPATFEATILGAALTAMAALLVALRLPELWHPVFEVDGFERASADRFWLAVAAEDTLFDPDRTRSALEALRPLRVVPLPASAT
jgi:hypothetical protein